MLKVIHVIKERIAHNNKYGTNDPPIAVRSKEGVVYCHGIKINGPSELGYWPDAPLKSGAKVYITTDAPVECNFNPLTTKPNVRGVK